MPGHSTAPDPGLSTEARLIAAFDLAERAEVVLRTLADLASQPGKARPAGARWTKAADAGQAVALQACIETLAADLAAIGALRDSTPVSVLAKAVRERAAPASRAQLAAVTVEVRR
jgi:hypothetical protein